MRDPIASTQDLDPEMKRELHLQPDGPLAQRRAFGFTPCAHAMREDRFVSGKSTMA
jgi:hypothetical protein